MSSYQPRNSRAYGSGRGGGYNYGGRSTGTTVPSLPPDRDIKQNLGSTALRTLQKPAATVGQSEKPLKVEHLRYIGSYNWVESPTPTIIVPGSPREWRDRAFPLRVPFDTGVRFADQNGFRMGSSSVLLPLFRAVDIVSEDEPVEWDAVDFVTDRNNLRKLLRWLNHSPGADDAAKPLREFRIDLQLGGERTVLMQRWEKRTREVAEPPKSGCGFNFELENTLPAKGCERGTGHHRIVKYELGGLKLVVRFEVDACLPQPAPRAAAATTARAAPSHTNVDDLSDLLSGLNVATPAAPSSPSAPAASSSALAVIRAGTRVPQSSLVEMTTRSKRFAHEFDWADAYPQLFLSHTPHHFLALHERGTFERVVRRKLGAPEFAAVERDSAMVRGFHRLVHTLRAIQTLVKAHGQRGRLSLVCSAEGVLRVYERTSDVGCMPDEELTRFGV